MTTTYTREFSFTEANARKLAGQVAADLFLMQILYDEPIKAEIDDCIEELVILLLGDGESGYLKSVDYGFRKDGKWVLALSYSADYEGNVSRTDRSGGVPPGKDISGASWYSYLRKNSRFFNLPDSEKERIERLLPFKRTPAGEPQLGAGEWKFDRTYSSGGVSVKKCVFE